MRHPADWIARPLAEVVDILDARRLPVKAADRAKLGGDVPYYGATGQAGRIDRAIFNEPLVLLGEDGAPFFDASKSKAYLIEGPAWVNNHAHVLRPRPGLDRRFLKYFLDVFDYRGYANGTTRLKLTQGAMRSIPVPIPDNFEQRRIVEILEDHLSRLDAAGDYESVALRRIGSLREELIRRAVIGADVSGPRKAPGLADAGTQDGDLAELPESWTWRRLGEIADVVGGVTKDAKKQSLPGQIEVPYLRVANVQRGALRLDDITRIRVSPEKADALRLIAGDVLLNEGGDRDKLARGWVWQDEVANCIHQNHVFRARVRVDLDPYFLSWTANTIGGRWAERNGKQSVNLASISLSMIRRMPVVVPAPGVSTGIVARLRGQMNDIDRLERATRASIARRSALRRAVLAAAFEGKLTGRHTDAEMIEELTDV